MAILKYNEFCLNVLVLRLETMYEARGQDNIASASIQTYDDMETFELNGMNEKRNSSCVRKEISVEHCESKKKI